MKTLRSHYIATFYSFLLCVTSYGFILSHSNIFVCNTERMNENRIDQKYSHFCRTFLQKRKLLQKRGCSIIFLSFKVNQIKFFQMRDFKEKIEMKSFLCNVLQKCNLNLSKYLLYVKTLIEWNRIKSITLRVCEQKLRTKLTGTRLSATDIKNQLNSHIEIEYLKNVVSSHVPHFL